MRERGKERDRETDTNRQNRDKHKDRQRDTGREREIEKRKVSDKLHYKIHGAPMLQLDVLCPMPDRSNFDKVHRVAYSAELMQMIKVCCNV